MTIGQLGDGSSPGVDPGPLVCPVCRAPLVPGARFCHNCGASLPAAATGEPAGTERRVVTVLFGDLSDFTAWAEDLDPERVGEVTSRVLAVLTKAVADSGGAVDKLTGDGVMAVFGAPTAHEDDPERAVRAAALMQSEVRRLMQSESGGGRRMGLRVGVNTGEVLAGVQASLSYTVVGDTVNTAARLSDAAGIGSVLAGRDTALATMSTASWRTLSALRLKGKREPVPAYELIGLRPLGAARVGLGEEAAFLGRDAELGRCVGRLLDVVDSRRPATMVVVGEAGIGKTRLAVELSRFAGDLPDLRVLWGRCPPFGENRDLSALAEWVRTLAGVGDDQEPEAALEAARRGFARLARGSGEPVGPVTVDRLLALLGLVERGSAGPRDAAAPGAAAVADPVVDAVATVVAAATRSGPLLLVLDDAQWATPGLLDSLARMAAGLSGAVLLVVLGRPDTLEGPWTGVMPDLEMLPIAPLDANASERLLRAYLDGAELGEPARSMLLDRAQGNPFFLSELLHLLVDRGLLRREGDGWRVEGELPREVLPSGVQAVLAARIDSLAPLPRALLRDAAIVGTRFTQASLAALAPPGGAGDTEVAAALDELVGRGMVLLAEGSEPPAYAFSHGLARDVAYAGVPKAERARRHATLATWTARNHDAAVGQADPMVASQAERAVELAGEIGLAAGDPVVAEARRVGVAALLRLGEASLARDDHQRGEALLTRGLTLVGDAGDGDLVDRLLVGRAAARTSMRRLDEAEADLVRPRESSQLRTRSAALVVLGDLLRRRGDDAAATSALVSGMAAASDAGASRITGEALRQLGMIAFLTGRLATAVEQFGQARDLARQVGDGRGEGWALQHLAWTSTVRGDYEVAETILGEAATVFRSLDDDGGLGWCTGTEAFVRLLQGRSESARQLARGLLPIGRARGDTWGVAACLAIDGFAAAELGDITTGVAEASEALTTFSELGDAWGQSMALVAAGAAYRGAGRLRRAVRRLERAVEIGTSGTHAMPTGLALGVLGYCRLDLGDPSGAQAAAERALGQFEGMDVRPGALVGLRVLLAQSLRAQHRGDEALVLLREARTEPHASLVFPRRQALAHLAGTLLEQGETAEALQVVTEAMAVPAQDLRSRIVTLRVLGSCLLAVGDRPAALVALRQAVALAGATEMSSERSASRKALEAAKRRKGR